MIFPKLLFVISSICFLLHSAYNFYDNNINVKTVEYVSTLNLTGLNFPFNFRITIMPGNVKLSCKIESRKKNMSFIGIDNHKLEENGINDIWGFYLAMGEEDQVSYKNVSNITGEKIEKVSVKVSKVF